MANHAVCFTDRASSLGNFLDVIDMTTQAPIRQHCSTSYATQPGQTLTMDMQKSGGLPGSSNLDNMSCSFERATVGAVESHLSVSSTGTNLSQRKGSLQDCFMLPAGGWDGLTLADDRKNMAMGLNSNSAPVFNSLYNSGTMSDYLLDGTSDAAMSAPLTPSPSANATAAAVSKTLADAAANSASLYVKNLGPDTDELWLYQRFAPLGALLSCKVKTDPVTGKCRGVGFVNYVDHGAAVRAINQLHGSRTPEGRQLHITLQAPRAARAAAAAATAAVSVTTQPMSQMMSSEVPTPQSSLGTSGLTLQLPLLNGDNGTLPFQIQSQFQAAERAAAACLPMMTAQQLLALQQNSLLPGVNMNVNAAAAAAAVAQQQLALQLRLGL